MTNFRARVVFGTSLLSIAIFIMVADHKPIARAQDLSGSSINAPIVIGVQDPAPHINIAPSFFYRDLTLGASGPDVHALQQFLNALGGQAEVALTGPGSPGNETDYYGLYTMTAVARWQTIEGILPAEGYFDATTRGRVASLLEGPG